MKLFLSTAVLGLLCAAVVLGLQRHHLAKLERQAGGLRTAIAELQGKAGLGSDRSSTPPGPDNGSRRVASRARPDLDTVQAELESLIKSNEGARSDPATIHVILSDLVEAVGECNADDLVALAERLGARDLKREPKELVTMILKMLAVEQDPLRFLKTTTEEVAATEIDLQGAAISALARRDPNAAMEWMFEHGENFEDRFRQLGMVAIGTQLLRSDVSAAVDFLRRLQSDERRSLLQALGLIRFHGAEDLVAAARALPDPEVRREILSVAVASIMLHDGIEAGRTSLATLGDPEDYAAAVEAAASTAIDSRPADTMNWLINSPPGSPEAEAIGNAIAPWAESDFSSAAAWLGKQPASANRDRAIESFAQVVEHLDPEAATIWATEISDPVRRESVVQGHLEAWKARDSAAAAAWETTHARE